MKVFKSVRSHFSMLLNFENSSFHHLKFWPGNNKIRVSVDLVS